MFETVLVFLNQFLKLAASKQPLSQMIGLT
jgi:hypothetical protein